MKRLILPLLLSFLFQSCFSYKAVNFNDIKNEKKQIFEVSKLDKTNIKGRLVSIDENVMVLENRNGNQTINKSEVYDIRTRKFSFTKTAGGAVGAYGALVGIALLVLILGPPLVP